MNAQGIAFLKGHGTENDFVVVPDLDGLQVWPTEAVAAVCDRRAGIGADGLLRVVRVEAEPDATAFGGQAEYFMDYRNADGSIAEMCGNGVRVFARYLLAAGLVSGDSFPVATRAGVRTVTVLRPGDTDSDLSVDMGVAVLSGADVEVAVGGHRWPALAVDMGNPHAVARIDDLAEAGALLDAPDVSPSTAFLHGVNVEFVVDAGPGHVAMRVHERGSGETRSCGTGACAVAVAATLAAAGPAGPTEPRRWTVDVPGGRLTATVDPDLRVELAGPAALVAEGVLGPELSALVGTHAGR